MKIRTLTVVIAAILLQTGCEPSYTSGWKPITRSQLIGNHVSSMEPIQKITLLDNGSFIHEFDIGANHYSDTSGWRFGTDNQSGCFIVFDSARCFRWDPYRKEPDPYFRQWERKCGLYKGKVVIAIDVTDVPYVFVRSEK